MSDGGGLEVLDVRPELLPDEPLPPALAAGAAERRRAIRVAAARTLGRRQATKRVATVLCAVATAVCLAPLVALIAYTTARGIHALSLGFLLHEPTPPGIPGGGIANAVVGSLLIVGLGATLAIPLGILAALFLFERRGMFASALRLAGDVLAGVPSIAIGIFAYAVVVEPLGFSALAGSAALGVLMLPIVMRSAEAAMRSVPVDLREAALALGARRSRVARSVVLRGALAGLVTGSLLALARAVGETAPLLFTAFGNQFFNLSPTQPTAALPLVIFSSGTQPFPDAQQVAWGTALVLLMLVLVLSLGARAIAGRLTRTGRRAPGITEIAEGM
ncbi:MAG TPA: phosphate ABC transporter permease PstA [Actinomycetota bacterium]|nr:phosphate ABC transporter permease PstA [Actinomycetota bacterium]